MNVFVLTFWEHNFQFLENWINVLLTSLEEVLKTVSFSWVVDITIHLSKSNEHIKVMITWCEVWHLLSFDNNEASVHNILPSFSLHIFECLNSFRPVKCRYFSIYWVFCLSNLKFCINCVSWEWHLLGRSLLEEFVSYCSNNAAWEIYHSWHDWNATRIHFGF